MCNTLDCVRVLWFCTFMHLADAFIQSDLQLHSGYTFLISICVPWESNPQPLTTQEHLHICVLGLLFFTVVDSPEFKRAPPIESPPINLALGVIVLKKLI